MLSVVFAAVWSILSIGSGHGDLAVSKAQPSAESLVTVDQARNVFVGAGYVVDEPTSWTWTAPPVTVFHVQDPSSDRLAVVLVYGSQSAADTARSRPQPLVIGYSAEAWRANVAIAQTTRSELDRLQRARDDCDNGIVVPDGIAMVETPGLVQTRSTSGFLRALDFGADNF